MRHMSYQLNILGIFFQQALQFEGNHDRSKRSPKAGEEKSNSIDYVQNQVTYTGSLCRDHYIDHAAVFSHGADLV